MFADVARRVGCVIALAVLAGLPRVLVAQQILETNGSSLTNYIAGAATAAQGVSPRFDQRGVGLDGSLRAGSTLGWMAAGNPFGEGVVGGARLGEVNLCTGSYHPTAVDIALPAPGATNHATDFASGDDPNTDFGVTETGSGLRVITTYTYDSQGRVDETTLPSGRVTKNYYTKLTDGRMVTLSIPRYVSGSSTAYGPVGYTVTNLAGKVEFQATLAVGTVTLSGGGSIALSSWVDSTTGDEFSAVHSTLGGASRANFQNVSKSVYSEGGTKVTESRMYYDVPSSGFGSAGTNYDKTEMGYDTMGRRVMGKSPDGTITRTLFDTLGRATESWIGTDDTGATDTDPDGSGGANNMVKTSTTTYDGGSAGGNSYVTSRAQDADGDWTGSSDRRTTNYTNDVRGRVIVVENPQSPHVFNKYDNRGRGVATGLFSSIASISVGSDDPTTETTNRVGLSQTFYDERGQVWKSQRHNIDVADGSDDDNLQTLNWYDADGQLIKTDGEQLTKTVYDRLHRAVEQYTLASDNDTVYADADDVTGDYVLEERERHQRQREPGVPDQDRGRDGPDDLLVQRGRPGDPDVSRGAGRLLRPRRYHRGDVHRPGPLRPDDRQHLDKGPLDGPRLLQSNAQLRPRLEHHRHHRQHPQGGRRWLGQPQLRRQVHARRAQPRHPGRRGDILGRLHQQQEPRRTVDPGPGGELEPRQA